MCARTEIATPPFFCPSYFHIFCTISLKCREGRWGMGRVSKTDLRNKRKGKFIIQLFLNSYSVFMSSFLNLGIGVDDFSLHTTPFA